VNLITEEIVYLKKWDQTENIKNNGMKSKII